MSTTVGQCGEVYSINEKRIEDFYKPRRKVITDLIKKVKAEGGDPTKYSPAEGVTIDLHILLKNIDKAKADATKSAEGERAKCEGGAVPNWVGDAQMVADVATMIAAAPFILLTKNLAAAHIDLGEIYKGKPLGGDNALIPKARDDVLDALGIGGEVAKVLKQPEVVIQLPLEGAEHLAREIRKIFGW